MSLAAPLAPHVLQRGALAAMDTGLPVGGRGKVVMPCGGGKTLVGRFYAEQIDADIVVLCTPWIELAGQLLRDYRAAHHSWPHRSMVVCSDKEAGRAVRILKAELPAWAREAVTASTSVADIVAFLKTNKPGARLIATTYHSAHRVGAALRRAGLRAAFLFCDEFHHLIGMPRKEFRDVLDDHLLPADRRVFATATPLEIELCAAEGRRGGLEPIALDDEDAFGPELYRASHEDAVKAGVIVDYDIDILVRRGKPGENSHDATVLDAIMAAITDGGSTRILTFHHRVNGAKTLAERLDGYELPDGRHIMAAHLAGTHGSAYRREVLDRLANPPENTVVVVPSAYVLREGVDVPGVDTVVPADPPSSARLIIQMAGRAARKALGKIRGRIVLPVTLSADLDEHSALTSSKWRHIWIILCALANSDPRLSKLLRSAAGKSFKKRATLRGDGPGLTIDAPDDIDLRQWVLKALDRTGGQWWAMFERVRTWTAKHGHARPDADATIDGMKIRPWVRTQCSLYARGLLTDEQVDALESLFGWAWTDDDVAFWHGWEAWYAFHSTPRPRETSADYWAALAAAPATTYNKPPREAYGSLAEFAAVIAMHRRLGTLAPRLERAANQLPRWTWSVLSSDDTEMLDALADYVDSYDDFNVPHDFCDDKRRPVGQWITALRRRRVTGRLDPILAAHITVLHALYPNAIPLEWRPRETIWRLNFLALLQFVKREGTCRIPPGHIEKLPDYESRLYEWATRQRHRRRRRLLSSLYITTLEQVDGWMWELASRTATASPGELCGTRRGYRRGCICDRCVAANLAAPSVSATGTTDLIDASRARGHVRILLGRGATLASIAGVAKVGIHTIHALANGNRARIRPDTADAILTVTAKDVLPAGRRPTAQRLNPQHPTPARTHHGPTQAARPATPPAAAARRRHTHANRH